MSSTAEQSKQRRIRSLAEGRCAQCWKRKSKARMSRTLCASCTTKAARHQLARVIKRQLAGKCRQCGKKRGQYAAYCDRCAALHRRDNQTYYATHKKAA